MAIYDTPLLSEFIGDVIGQSAYMQWTPITTAYSSSFKYELQYKKSTDINYTDISKILTDLDYTHKVTEPGLTYNYRIRPKLDYLYVKRDIITSRNITTTRNILPSIAATEYGAYSNITLNLLYSYYLEGYSNEIIEIPKVYSDSLNDDIVSLQSTLGGLKIRKIQNGSKNIIQLETRPADYTKVQKLYAYLKSRMWQKETIYIDSLKKEIVAYVEIKKIERNNSGDRNLYSLSIEVQEA